MRHLKIEGSNSSIESVSMNILNNIYNLTLNNEFDSTSNLIGRVDVNYLYDKYYDYIVNTYNNFRIIINIDKLLKFEDPEVETVLLNNSIGISGLGIPYSTLSSVSSIPSFANNTNITSFNELRLFTNVKTLQSNCFDGCTNLESIDISNLKTSTTQSSLWYTFYNCSKLTNLGITEFPNPFHNDAYHTFHGCTSLGVGKTLEIWYNEYYKPGSGTFRKTGYKHVIAHGMMEKQYPGGGESYPFYDMPNAEIKDFSDCTITTAVGWNGGADPNVVTIINPPTVNYLGWSTFTKNSYDNFRHFILLSDSVPTPESTEYWNLNNDGFIYVRDELVEAYKNHEVWSTKPSITAKIKPLSELPSDVTWYTKDRDFSQYFN